MPKRRTEVAVHVARLAYPAARGNGVTLYNLRAAKLAKDLARTRQHPRLIAIAETRC